MAILSIYPLKNGLGKSNVVSKVEVFDALFVKEFSLNFGNPAEFNKC